MSVARAIGAQRRLNTNVGIHRDAAAIVDVRSDIHSCGWFSRRSMGVGCGGGKNRCHLYGWRNRYDGEKCRGRRGSGRECDRSGSDGGVPGKGPRRGTPES